MRSLMLLLALLACARPAAAQFPGELRGRVVSAESGSPVGAALVELPALGRSALSDATGAFHLRGVEPGVHAVAVSSIGFARWQGEAEVRNGRVARLRVELAPAAVAVEGVQVVAQRERPSAGGVRVERAEIQRRGARTVGDVVRQVPGVVLRQEGPGSPQAVSIRGSGTDAVLVLVDGVPINDPVTGVADLSTVPAQAVEAVTVLTGAQGARYGPRAQAGVVLIETRAPEAALAARLATGTLGEWMAGAEAGGMQGGLGWSAGGHLRRVDGTFEYPRVAGVDDTPTVRRNADLAEHGAFVAAQATLAGGELRGRAGVEALRRGLPGKGYAPSTEARQETDRLRAALGWRRAGPALTARLSAAGAAQHVRYADPAPPFGLPYDDHARVRSLDLRAELERAGRGWLRAHGAGTEARAQRIVASSLSERVPRARTDVGAFAHAAGGAAVGGWDVELFAELRADRDALAQRWYANHAAGVRLAGGGAALQLANRSGYSPPSLGDQFFREGVAVAPNPDLQPERVPSEWELEATLSGRALGGEAGAGARLYQGDIRGMIVWLPDFRFVWSPQNTDVRRHGAELWGEWSAPALGVRLAGSYALAAVTYDRAGDADDEVQVAYRPRHTAQLRAEWGRGGWSTGAGALFTGTRFPAPAALNALPPFWTLDLHAAREWRLGPAAATAALRVERLMDETDSLIFGFPEAGRRVRLELQLRRADPLLLSGGST